MSLLPLDRSWAGSELERELKALVIEIFDDTFREQLDDVNVYGVPHLGSFALVERNVTQDGLIMLRRNEEAAMRYLFMAWRHLNPKRGTHFLATYLRALFGSVFDIQQLWQEKEEVYPTALMTKDEILVSGGNINDYFLTSRLQVLIDTDAVPAFLVRAMQSAVAARLVLEVSLAKTMTGTIQIGQLGRMVPVARFSGTPMAAPRDHITEQEVRLGQIGRLAMMARSTGSVALRIPTPQNIVYINPWAVVLA